MEPSSPILAAGKPLGRERMFVLAGPCVLETRELTRRIAGRLREIADARDLPLVFKASFDKANRSSGASERGPGLEQGLEWLAGVREEFGLPVVTDVHLPEQCAAAAEAVDVLQIPAFLCRQTDLLVAAARTGRVVNIKKGQFLAPWDMGNAVQKCRDAGNDQVLVTERGTSFGYGRLVVDMAGFADLAEAGAPVVFDATHSVQEPGGLGNASGGRRQYAPLLARAALAAGADALFIETHDDPANAQSDAATIWPIDQLQELLEQCKRVHGEA